MTARRDAGPRRDATTGTWWFVVDLGSDGGGKRRQAKRRGFRTKDDAQQALDALRVSVTTQTFVAPAKQTVGEYLDE
jgi:integrase